MDCRFGRCSGAQLQDAAQPPPERLADNLREAPHLLGTKLPISAYVRTIPPTAQRVVAAGVLAMLLSHPGFEADSDGVSWVRRGSLGNELFVDGVGSRGFDDKNGYYIGRPSSTSPLRDFTLFFTRESASALNAKKDALAGEGLTQGAAGFDLAELAAERLGAAAVIAFAFLEAEMARELIAVRPQWVGTDGATVYSKDDPPHSVSEWVIDTAYPASVRYIIYICVFEVVRHGCRFF